MTTWILAAFVAAVLLFKFVLGRKAPMNVVEERIKAGAQVVDVRSPEEFAGGAFPGARNIPVQDLQRRMNELKKDVAVVLYCASGARSGMAARMLKAAGFADVTNAGGLGDMPRP